jgi:glycosyltransferase involved in cell wall biosynthesis
MRVLYVDLEREWRGGQSQALLTLRGLRERGHEVELLAAKDSPLAIRAAPAGIAVHQVARFGLRAWAAVAMRGLLKHSRFDLAHLNEPHALTAAWLGGSYRNVPLVISRRVAYPLGQSALARRRYQTAQRILAVSRFVTKSVMDSGVPAEKVEIIYDGVEVPPPVTAEARQRARRRWGVSETELLMGCVGYLLPEKGQEVAVRALSIVRAQVPGARLLLAGDGPCLSKLESLARQQGLQNALIFAGFVEDVERVYAALDIFVFPSLAEPLGTSLLVAMAWGLPVLAIASGGIPEYVEDGGNGLLAAQPDSELLSAGMFRLLSDESLRMRLGQAARRCIAERFSAERMVENTLRVYEDVIKQERLQKG